MARDHLLPPIEAGSRATAPGLRRVAAAGRAADGSGVAWPDAAGYGAGARGVPEVSRRRSEPALGRTRPLLRRGGRSHAANSRRERSAATSSQARRHRGRVDLDVAQPAAPQTDDDLLALDEALAKLAAKDPVKAQLVQLRVFAGLTLAEAAEILGLSISGPTATGLMPGPGSASRSPVATSPGRDRIPSPSKKISRPMRYSRPGRRIGGRVDSRARQAPTGPGSGGEGDPRPLLSQKEVFDVFYSTGDRPVADDRRGGCVLASKGWRTASSSPRSG